MAQMGVDARRIQHDAFNAAFTESRDEIGLTVIAIIHTPIISDAGAKTMRLKT